MSPDDPRHGTVTGHYAGCREACCRDARNEDERRRRKHRQVFGVVRSVDNTGTVRRIQALWAIGWRSIDIARACGWTSPQAVTEIVSTRSTTYAATAAVVAQVYEQMSMTHGPSAKNRRLAPQKGWAPPLAWDDIDTDEHPNLGGRDDQPDPVVVDRLLAGDMSLARTATTAERRAVVAAWTRSLAELERLTGWRADRYVEREEGAA